MLSVVLYSSGCCKAEFIAQQHVDLSLEVPGGDARMQLRNAYSFVPPSLQGSKALNMEFGVREGGSINMLARHTGTDTRWDGFDSFQGLPANVGAGRIQGWGGGRYSTHGKLPEVPEHVHLHVGWFNETLPPFLDDQLATGRRMVAFMNMDADLYVSTIAVFDAVFSRCMHRNGTVISFDELFGTHQILAHEWRALTEAAHRYHFSFRIRFISFARTPSSRFARASVQIDRVAARSAHTAEDFSFDRCSDRPYHSCFRTEHFLGQGNPSPEITLFFCPEGSFCSLHSITQLQHYRAARAVTAPAHRPAEA